MKLNDIEVRHWLLDSGGDVSDAARHFEVTRQAIYDSLKRANTGNPLTHGRAGASQAHINTYLKACLDRMGILHD